MSGEGEGEAAKSGLARSVSAPMLTLYGLGTMLGAGIYVVIGEIIGAAGHWAPLSFAAAALVAALTGASFAELAGRLPSSGGPVAWSEKAFDQRWLSVALGWAIVATGVVSAATITTGFVGYANLFIDLSKWWLAPLLLGTLTLVAAIGVKQSAWFMALTTAVGVAGLLLVLWEAGPNIPEWPDLVGGGASAPASSGIVAGVLMGGFLAFYAFIGFEDLAHLGEEVRDVRRSMPIAIFVTIGVSLLFYVAVAAAAVTTLAPAALAESKAPLVDVVRESGRSGTLLGALSLAIIANGALAQIVMASRAIHDLGKRRGGAPERLARVSERTHTPLLATLAVGAVTLALALLFSTKALASGTSAIMLVNFAVANAALIVLKRRCPPPENAFEAPAWIPWAGAATCLLLVAGQFLLGGGE